jgi:hypothetical protein
MHNTEHTEQVTLVRWFRDTYPAGHYRIFAVPNGEFRHKSVAQRLNSEGVTSGISDLIILDRVKHRVLFLEMKKTRKTLKNGSPSKENLASPEQIEFLEFVNGIECCDGIVAYGYLEAKELVTQWLD